MRRSLCLVLMLVLVIGMLAAVSAQPLTKVRVGACARTTTTGLGAPFAAATKMGYFRQEGIEVELVNLPGSTDCVKQVATREIDFTLPSVEPLAILKPQGVKARVFYTAYQNNTYGLAVPDDSPIKDIKDLRGKVIGVTNMSSAGVIIARAQAAGHGLNPDRDITIVVAGEGAQPAAMLRNKQVDALSQFDTQYALVENAGIKMRRLDNSDIAKFPANGFVALDETLKTKRKDAVALGRGYAKGTIFALTNPEAAVRIVYEVYPHTRPTGKDEATAVREDVKVLVARLEAFKIDKAGLKRWGENSEANYGAYADFMLKWGIIKEKVDGRDLITNDLIDDINRFDPAPIVADAKAYRAR